MRVLFLNSYFRTEITAASRLGTDRDEAFAHVGIEMLVVTPTPLSALTQEMRSKYRRIINSGKARGLKKVDRSKLTERRVLVEWYQS